MELRHIPAVPTRKIKVDTVLAILIEKEDAGCGESFPRPGLILLDLNLPFMNGFEFMRALKADSDLRRIPVIVLTTSEQEADRDKAFALGAAGYIVKPLDFKQFVKVATAFDAYWSLCELPSYTESRHKPPFSTE